MPKLDLLPHVQSRLTELKSNGPRWKGPFVDGITQSIMLEWKQDPFAAYLSLILGLKEPEPRRPEPGTPKFNLIWGDSFHVGLEYLIQTRNKDLATNKMLERFRSYKKDYVLEHDSIDIETSLFSMLSCYTVPGDDFQTEVQFDEFANDVFPELPPYRLRGKLDGLLGSNMLEHKCKKRIYPSQLKDEIDQDFQVNFYAAIMECTHVTYDMIVIPEAQPYYSLPNKRVSETKEAYTNRLYFTHLDTNKHTPIFRFKQNWLSQQPLPLRNIENYWRQTIIPLLEGITKWYEHVTAPNFDLADPRCYNSVFYRHPIRAFLPSNTDSFKGKFYNLLTGIDDISEYPVTKSMFDELDEESVSGS